MSGEPSRRRGRPPLDSGQLRDTPVNVRLPATDYDRTQARALAERRSVPELMRRAVAAYLARPAGDDDDPG